MKVSTSPDSVEGNDWSARAAGPFATAPAVVYLELWHGQTNSWPLNRSTVQPSWVHTAVSTLKVLWEVRATRKLPGWIAAVTSAALPTAPRALPAPTGTVTVRPDTEPLTTGSAELPVGVGEGDVGLSPPHPGRTAPRATRDAA